VPKRRSPRPPLIGNGHRAKSTWWQGRLSGTYLRSLLGVRTSACAQGATEQSLQAPWGPLQQRQRGGDGHVRGSARIANCWLGWPGRGFRNDIGRCDLARRCRQATPRQPSFGWALPNAMARTWRGHRPCGGRAPHVSRAKRWPNDRRPRSNRIRGPQVGHGAPLTCVHSTLRAHALQASQRIGPPRSISRGGLPACS
jgi:hypothetical protein